MINDKIRIEDININYIQYGSGKINMVLLHGWGQNIKMMMPIANAFKSIFKITIIDLPGFGSSDEPKEVLTITDYADIIHKLLNKLVADGINIDKFEIKKPTLNDIFIEKVGE